MKMTMIESSDKEVFLQAVNEQLDEIGERLFSIKCQRNLFYSLSGSTHEPKEMVRETSSLKEGYVAFIVWRNEDPVDETFDFDDDAFDGET
jgi:hypothetical protein